jgi:hypothetical protein
LTEIATMTFLEKYHRLYRAHVAGCGYARRDRSWISGMNMGPVSTEVSNEA